jgi:pSer/pThr/pTyr-binding forkhead associated (FHA) protein/predicted nucleic acid-binding Zn ribbon protein
MKCPSCGKENPAGEQYCLDCGAELAATTTPAAASAQPAGGSLAYSDEEFQRLLNQQTPAAAPKTCPHCGTAAPAGGQFCDNCGEPLDAPAQPAASPADATQAAPAATNGAPAASQPAQPASTSVNPHAATISPAPPADQQQNSAPAAPAAAQAGPAVTLDLAGPTSSSSYMLAGDEAKIGRRDADAGIFPEVDFEGNDFVTEGNEKVHAVSRRHGRVFREGGEVKFEDLGSTNGTTLDGTPVLPHDPQTLKDGSVLVLGRTCRITIHIQ